MTITEALKRIDELEKEVKELKSFTKFRNLISTDYSEIELKMLARLTDEERLKYTKDMRKYYER